MTRFKDALLDELVAYAQRSTPPAHPTRPPRVRVIRMGGLAGAGAAAVLAVTVAVSVIAPAGQQAAYAVDENSDGTVTITVRELGHTADATRDLRAAGVPAQVVQLAAPGSCATTPGGMPMPTVGTGRAVALGMPSAYPFDGDISAWLPAMSATSLTINPSAIPPGAVVFIVEDIRPENPFGVQVGVALVNAPAPTCWEAVIHDATRLPTRPTPTPTN